MASIDTSHIDSTADGKNRNKGIEADTTKPNQNLLSEFVQSLGHSVIQAPLSGGAQLIDQISGGRTHLRESVQIAALQAPEQADFGTTDYWAQQAGNTIGMLGSFYVAGKLAKGVCRAGMSELDLTAALSERKALGLTMKESFWTGFANDALFRETDANDSRPFYISRALNGLSGGASMWTLSKVSSNFMPAAGEIASSKLVPLIKNNITGGVISGIPAGFVGAESNAYLANLNFTSTKDFVNSAIVNPKLATHQQLSESMISGAVIGGAFGTYHQLAGRLQSGRQNFGWEVNNRRENPQAGNVREFKVVGGEQAISKALARVSTSQDATLTVRENLGRRQGIPGLLGLHDFGGETQLYIKQSTPAGLNAAAASAADLIASCNLDSAFASKAVLAGTTDGDNPIFMRAGKTSLSFATSDHNVDPDSVSAIHLKGKIYETSDNPEQSADWAQRISVFYKLANQLASARDEKQFDASAALTGWLDDNPDMHGVADAYARQNADSNVALVINTYMGTKIFQRLAPEVPQNPLKWGGETHVSEIDDRVEGRYDKATVLDLEGNPIAHGDRTKTAIASFEGHSQGVSEITDEPNGERTIIYNDETAAKTNIKLIRRLINGETIVVQPDNTWYSHMSNGNLIKEFAPGHINENGEPTNVVRHIRENGVDTYLYRDGTVETRTVERGAVETGKVETGKDGGDTVGPAKSEAPTESAGEAQRLKALESLGRYFADDSPSMQRLLQAHNGLSLVDLARLVDDHPDIQVPLIKQEAKKGADFLNYAHLEKLGWARLIGRVEDESAEDVVLPLSSRLEFLLQGQQQVRHMNGTYDQLYTDSLLRHLGRREVPQFSPSSATMQRLMEIDERGYSTDDINRWVAQNPEVRKPFVESLVANGVRDDLLLNTLGELEYLAKYLPLGEPAFAWLLKQNSYYISGLWLTMTDHGSPEEFVAILKKEIEQGTMPRRIDVSAFKRFEPIESDKPPEEEEEHYSYDEGMPRPLSHRLDPERFMEADGVRG